MINNITIVIVTYNSAKWIANCLQSVFRTEYKNFNVIVVDNASGDESATIITKEFPQAKLIQLKDNVGFSGGNNIGIQQALEDGSDAVVLLNPDTQVKENWLDELVKASHPNEVGITQAMLLLGDDKFLTNNVGNAMHYLGFGFVKHYKESFDNWRDKEPFDIGYASGAAMLIKKEVIQQIGYFDAKLFMYNDDEDFCWRSRMAGYRIIIAPKSIVYHYYEFSRNKLKFYWNERNRWILLLQNYSAKTLFIILPMLIIIEFMMFFYSLIGGWIHLKIKSYFWILANMYSISKQRKNVQKMRKLNDKEVIRHMDAKLEFSEVSNPILKYFVSPFVELYFKIVKNFI